MASGCGMRFSRWSDRFCRLSVCETDVSGEVVAEGKGNTGGYLRGILFCCLATVCWSLSGAFVRSVPSIDPWTINAYRGLSTGISLFIYMVVRYRGNIVRHIFPAAPMGFVVAAGFFAAGSTLYILALSMASVASVSVLGATSPIFAALLAWMMVGERTSPLVMMATILVLVGVYLIASAEEAVMQSGLLGTFVGVMVAFTFAGQTVSLRRYRHMEMTPAIMYGGFLVTISVLVIRGLPILSLHDYAVIALMGIVQLAVPLVLYIEGSKHVPAVQAILISLGDVVLNPTWAWLTHGEAVRPGVFLGGALIVSAILMATVWPQLRKPRVKVPLESRPA
jgi:drug/metabolite transporter (DMT)-like permease